jgi:phosphopantetheinyl transferase
MMGGTPEGTGPAIARATWDQAAAWLSPEEIDELCQRGTVKRQQDRIAGRVAAKQAVSKLTSAKPEDIRIHSRASGEPFAIVDTYKLIYVSISHRDGHAIAVADHQRIGIDLEGIEHRDTHFITDWFRHDEQLLVRSTQILSSVAWSIKEAVLKVLGRGMALSPHDIAIRAINEGDATIELFGEAASCHRELGEGNIAINWELEQENEVIVTARLAA